MNETFTVATPEDFSKVIETILMQVAVAVELPLVITLAGDLGAGKTTFVQQLGKVLGVTEYITSPTFTIMKQYEVVHESFDTLVHIDAYRIDDESELGPLKITELFTTPRTVICIEWPEHISASLPKEIVQVAIEIKEGETREVSVCRSGL